MIIRNIHVKDFKSIGELEIDFTKTSGVYEIYGKVGAGKTTIGEAILFGLFGTIRNKNTRDLIRWGKKTSTIEINVLSKNNELKITRVLRGNVSSLDVICNGEPLIFTNKRDAQKILETDYYDISKLVVETLFVISFNNFKSISNLNTVDTKEFLDKVFNLQILTDYVNVCKQILRNLQTEEKVQKANLSHLEEQIQMYTNLKSDISFSKEDYDNAALNLKVDKEKLATYEKSRTDKVNKLQTTINKISSDIGSIKQQKTSIQKNIDLIKKKICPTCGTVIDDSHLNSHIEHNNELDTKLKTLQDTLQEKQSALRTLNQKADAAISKLRQTITELDKQISKYDDREKLIKTYESSIKDKQEQLKKQKQIVSKLSNDLIQYDELCNILNSNVRHNFLKSVVPLINYNLEHYIYKLGLSYSIHFADDFSCSISTPDRNDIPTSSLSTGQNKIVDMVIVLSILKVLLNSFNMNVLFLDELFSNLDNEARDTMCSLLKEELNQDKTIFIISHQPLNMDIVDGKIQVDRISHNNESVYTII